MVSWPSVLFSEPGLLSTESTLLTLKSFHLYVVLPDPLKTLTSLNPTRWLQSSQSRAQSSLSHGVSINKQFHLKVPAVGWRLSLSHTYDYCPSHLKPPLLPSRLNPFNSPPITLREKSNSLIWLMEPCGSLLSSQSLDTPSPPLPHRISAYCLPSIWNDLPAGHSTPPLYLSSGITCSRKSSLTPASVPRMGPPSTSLVSPLKPQSHMASCGALSNSASPAGPQALGSQMMLITV